MAWEVPLRFPLSSGDTGFGRVDVTSLFGVVAFGPLFFLSFLPAWAIWVVAAFVLLWLVLLIVLARRTWSARASDVRIDRSGLEVLSGPLRGKRLPWSSLAGRRIRVVHRGELAVLAIGREVLAHTRVPEEAASLEALAATLRAGADDRAPDAPIGPQVSKCARCGAPLVPDDVSAVACRFCRAENELPERVRHIAGAARASQRVERAVAALLRWPPAWRLNVWLAASFVSATLGWPFFAACALVLQSRDPNVAVVDLVVVFTCGICAGFTFPSLLSLGMTERRSFELLSARFAAAPPPSPEAPHACRQCGGPLPEPHGRSTTPAVAVCAYCEANNVVGLGLAREAHAAGADAESLTDLVKQRLAMRRARRVRSVLLVAVLLFTPWQFANAMFELPCFGPVGACDSDRAARWCIGGATTHVRCAGPRGCARTGLRLYCDQSVAAQGDACIGPGEGAACTEDGSSLLRCRDDRFALVATCGGPRGCYREEGAVRCDGSVAAADTPCEGDSYACAADGRSLLACREGRWGVLHPTDTCTIGDAGRLVWTGAYAVIGERCGEGGAACTADGRLLRCDHGALAPFVDCRGPTGCTTEGTRASCDQSIAEAGERCAAAEGAACSVERDAMLRCRDGEFVRERSCPGGCRIADGQLSCRVRR